MIAEWRIANSTRHNASRTSGNASPFSFCEAEREAREREDYALILWNHGGSSSAGPSACWDYTNNKDCLTMKEIKEALTDIHNTLGSKIDILAFDACLMGTIEVAYQIRDYADYMVASEETEPGDGYPYDRILAELAASPSMSASQLAITIVTKYASSYTDGALNPEDDPSITSSAINLTKIGETAVAVSQLAESIIGDFNNSKSVVREAWMLAETFHGDFVDLYHFTLLLKDKVSNATIKLRGELVLNAVNGLVISESHGDAHSNANGISIYYPRRYDKLSYTELDFVFDTLWDEFLNLATNIEAEISPVCSVYASDENMTFMDVAVGDVDGDGACEIVAVGNYTDEMGDVYFAIVVFDVTESSLNELCSLIFSLGYYESLNSVICADTDQDMLDEIVVTGCYYNVSNSLWYSYIGILTVVGNEIVVQAYDEGYMIFVESLDVADVDGDYFPEIVVSGWLWDGLYTCAYVMVGNNSAVTYLQKEAICQWYIGYDSRLQSVAVGDTDADGLAEIVVGGVYYDYFYGAWVAYLAVLNCTGNTFFIQAYDSAVNFWINSVDVADVEGDGLNEIVLSGYCLGYNGIYMFIAIGSNLDQNELVGLGTYYWIVSGDSYICSVDVIDFDGDGIMEIIAVGYYYDMNSFVWRSYSAVLSWSQINGLVTENIHEGDSQTYSYSVTTGDIDNNNETEVIICSEEKGGSSRAKIEVVEASNHVTTTGMIFGTVTDGENPISNATIEISISRLSLVASVGAFQNGSYVIGNLPEGCYRVTAYANGKVNLTQNGIVVKAGQMTQVNFALIENVVVPVAHTVNINGEIFHVVTVSNSTISNFTFNSAAKSISFLVYAPTGSTGFCNVTFLKNLLGGPYTVKLDGILTEPIISSNETYIIIHLSYTHSLHTIEIVGSTVIPEFTTNLLLLLSLCISLFFTFLRKIKKSCFL
ncbi:MAG: clostripain-related cysteine peptidase [Candidatus Bathyarchaeia archaeon]